MASERGATYPTAAATAVASLVRAKIGGTRFALFRARPRAGRPALGAPASPSCRALPAISATILTKNSAALLADVLGALEWCDEVIVLDTGSSDTTLTIAAQYANVTLHQLNGPFPGFGRVRQLAVSLARNDWILAIDSDEIVSPALRAEIAALALDDPTVVYTIGFANFYNGKHITSCGWAPDRHERLFNRAATNFCASDVHERVRTRGMKVVPLEGEICHYSYRAMDDFLRKMAAYSQLFVAQNAGRKRSSGGKAVARSTWAFFKSYILERGVLQGFEGLVISAYKAQTVFWKYAMLHEANARRRASTGLLPAPVATLPAP